MTTWYVTKGSKYIISQDDDCIYTFDVIETPDDNEDEKWVLLLHGNEDDPCDNETIRLRISSQPS